MKPRHARCAAWIAALAMALHALWPLIAQARPATLVPVCTVSGVTHYVEIPGGNTPADSHQDHCALCVGGPAVSTQVVVQSLDAFSFAVPLASGFEAKTFAFVEADARAPPVLPWVNFNYGRIHEDAFVFGIAYSRLGSSFLRLGVLHG